MYDENDSYNVLAVSSNKPIISGATKGGTKTSANRTGYKNLHDALSGSRTHNISQNQQDVEKTENNRFPWQRRDSSLS